MITEYRHTGLVVNNIKKSYKFYCKFLDLKVIQDFIEEGDYFNQLIGEKKLKAKVIKAISPDYIYLELIEFINSKREKIKKPKKYTDVGQLHICFTVKNIFSVYKKLKETK